TSHARARVARGSRPAGTPRRRRRPPHGSAPRNRPDQASRPCRASSGTAVVTSALPSMHPPVTAIPISGARVELTRQLIVCHPWECPMPDYGNDLQFGTFVTPTVAQPELPVALAEISEQAGMDLVTFQDHPYQPAFQDTWTLLSYVAARTRRVHLAPNVLSLPLRQPAVMARAAAGLDLLTGGRLELGLGAGAFWDPIVAMGGPRRSPGESVEALAEAIEIMRGIWDVDDRGVLKVDGRHYAVAGAKRGP